MTYLDYRMVNFFFFEGLQKLKEQKSLHGNKVENGRGRLAQMVKLSLLKNFT